MRDIRNTFQRLRREKHLAKAATAKLLFAAGLGGKFSFDVRGVRLKFFPSEMTYEAWKRPDNYRSIDQEFLEKVLEPGGLVVDVGANIGMICMRAAKLVGPSGRVFAVEPNPRIAGYCEKNIALNGLKNITLLQTALGSEVGSVMFNCDDRDDCSGVVADGGIRIPLTTLDRVMEQEPNRPINLLKIDVEGFELSVLEGASETLKRTQWLYIEVEAENYAKYNRDPGDVMRILERNGFDAFYSDDAGKWQPINGSLPEDINLIGKRRVPVAQTA